MTKVKICGLSTVEAVDAAVEAGADYIGFVFADSRRQVSLEQAKLLASRIPASVKKVGVFVSPSQQDLDRATREVGLDLVQVHGQYDQDWMSHLAVPLIRAVQVTSGKVPRTQADFFLFDAPVAGSGATFDWEQLDTSSLVQPFFIAGGLNEDNVSQAIQLFHPYAVDVSSGVETAGKKDVDKIRRFIERAKNGISSTK